jgi:hypothetical protein
MKRDKIDELPIYAEQRLCIAPDHRADPVTLQPRRTAHPAPQQEGRPVLPPQLTDIQLQTLDLLGVPAKSSIG